LGEIENKNLIFSIAQSIFIFLLKRRNITYENIKSSFEDFIIIFNFLLNKDYNS